MKRNVIETVLGALVLAIAALFLTFAYSNSTIGHVGGYELHANFGKIDGLSIGADVKVSGVKVGAVTAMHLDPKTYLAETTMEIDNSIKVPRDSVAVIASEGLLGGKFMSIQIGGDPDMIPAGGKFDYTQSPPSLEDLLGQVIFNSAKSSNGNGGSGASLSLNGQPPASAAPSAAAVPAAPQVPASSAAVTGGAPSPGKL